MDSYNQTAYALLPISLIGFVINWSIFYAIHKLQSFNHSFGYSSANQAVADAFHSTAFLLYFCPMVLLESTTMKSFSYHCGFILLFCYELSVMTHLAISLNRFTAVWAPYKYKTVFSDSNTKILILGIYVFTATVAVVFYEKSCHFYYEENIHFLTFTNSEFCGYIGWYGNFLKNASIVAVVVSIDMLTVFRVRKVSRKGFVFMLELLTYFFIPQYFKNKWVIFFATSFAWVAVHVVDGMVVIVFNKEVRKFLLFQDIKQWTSSAAQATNVVTS